MAKSGYWRNETTAKPLSGGKSHSNKGNTESLHELVALQKQLLAAVKEEKTRPAIISHRQWEKNAEEKNKIRRLAGA